MNAFTPLDADDTGPRAPSPPAVPEALPILPLRDTVVFPGTVQALSIGRPSSLRLLEESLPQSKLLGLALQKEKAAETPGLDSLHEHGVIARVVRMLRQSDSSVVVLVHGENRMRIRRAVQEQPYLKAEIETLESQDLAKDDEIAEAAVRNLRESAQKLLELRQDVPDEVKSAFDSIEDAGTLTDFLAAHLSIETAEKQKLLEMTGVKARVSALQSHLDNQPRIAELQTKLRENVQSGFSEAQKRAYLREQLRAIQKELGEDGGNEEQVEDIRQRLDKAGLTEKAKVQADRELKRLEIIPPQSPDHSVIISYLETLAELPWNVLSDEHVDLHKAREILDRDHHGLEKVKKRLIEYLAVRKLNPAGRGPILCFLGPPGVGKTSLGQSIAEALGRKFARISLGGSAR